MIWRAGFRSTILALLAFTAAGAAFAEPDPAWSADEKAAAAADEAFHAASLTRGGQAWKDFADADVALPGARGKDEVGALYGKVYAKPGFRLDWHPTFAKVTGDIAVTSGPYEKHVKSESGADTRSTGTYVTVWQRQKDGGWRFVWDGGTEGH